MFKKLKTDLVGKDPLMQMENSCIEWLLDGEPWVEYRTRIDLLGQVESDPSVAAAYDRMIIDPQVQSLVEELIAWPGPPLKSHKKAGHLLHKLGFLSDIGITQESPGIREIMDKIMNHRSPEGLFQIVMNIAPSYGGRGEDELVWMICDTPLVMTSMIRFGLFEESNMLGSIGYLVNMQSENGWRCVVSPDLGKFRGPGRKDDPCPYANLLMLKLLAEFPEKHSDPEVKKGVETLLTLWEDREARRPYLFAMGTDFYKLKAPMVWYDLLHVTDVLTRFRWALTDDRLQQMVELLRSKMIEDGRFQAESIWMDWKGWEFGQKKVPSRWITYLANRVLKRIEM